MKATTIALIVIGILIVGALFFLPKPQSQQSNSNTTATSTSQKRTFNLVVKNKKLTGQTTLSAKQGDTVTFNVASDVAEELHLHGYDKHVDLEPGKTVSMTFTANLTGRFPFELEQTKTDLGVLEVQPK